MEGENRATDSLLESVTNTSSTLSQRHEQRRQSQRLHEQGHEQGEEQARMQEDNEGGQQDEKVRKLEATVEELRDRLDKSIVRVPNVFVSHEL